LIKTYFMITKPTDFDPTNYFAPYIKNAPGSDLIESLTESMHQTLILFDSISENKGGFSYEDGKWTIKQVFKHITDCERILSYRALRFARNDKTDLSGFNQDSYSEHDNTANLSLDSIKNDYLAVRLATIELYRSLNTESLDFSGTGNGKESSARITGWIISGHNQHHCNVINDRYLTQL
jgi:hypothetical protein